MRRDVAYYEQSISEARQKAEAYKQEAIDHLTAIPLLDHSEAMDSLDTIEKAVMEVKYYVNRIDVLSNILSSK